MAPLGTISFMLKRGNTMRLCEGTVSLLGRSMSRVSKVLPVQRPELTDGERTQGCSPGPMNGNSQLGLLTSTGNCLYNWIRL